MAARHEHLTDEEQRRQHALDRSWAAAQESLSDENPSLIYALASSACGCQTPPV